MTYKVEDKKILITGAGSLGTALTHNLLQYHPDIIRVLDNREMALFSLEKQIGRLGDVRLLLGDVRDLPRLRRAVEDVDVVFHTGAYKQIPFGEYDPKEFVLTNVVGTQNVIDASLDEEVDRVGYVSTDKACSPLNCYGVSKLMAEKLVTAANYYKGARRIRLFCVRYGNVFGSAGSVVPLFKTQLNQNQPLTMTDPQMTRFNITMGEAINFILKSLDTTRGAEVFIPKLKSYRLIDLAEAMIELTEKNVKTKTIGVRAGEKLHEMLYNENEARTIVDIGWAYAILPPDVMIKRFGLNYTFDDVKSAPIKAYTSKDVPKLSRQEIKGLLKREGFI